MISLVPGIVICMIMFLALWACLVEVARCAMASDATSPRKHRDNDLLMCAVVLTARL